MNKKQIDELQKYQDLIDKTKRDLSSMHAKLELLADDLQKVAGTKDPKKATVKMEGFQKEAEVLATKIEQHVTSMRRKYEQYV